MLCVECSAVWFRNWTLRRNEQKRLKAFEMWIWSRMERVKWTDKIKIKSSCARKSGRRMYNAGTDKEEEKKLSGPLVKKELPAEGGNGTAHRTD